MPFIITKDFCPDPTAKPGTNSNATGVLGPRSYQGDGSELKYRFRMLDDDREVMYEGQSHEEAFEPLDVFGGPNAGCTIIQYWKAGKGGGWQDL